MTNDDLRLADDFQNFDWRSEALPFRWRGLNLFDHLHAFDDLAEGSETLSIGIALAAEIQLRLVTDADGETRGRRVRAAARHRKRPVLVRQPRFIRPFERDGWKAVFSPIRIDVRLNHFDLDLIVWLIIGIEFDGAVEAPAIVVPAIYILQKIGGTDWRMHRVNFRFDLSQLRLNKDAHGPRVVLSNCQKVEPEWKQDKTNTKE